MTNADDRIEPTRKLYAIGLLCVECRQQAFLYTKSQPRPETEELFYDCISDKCINNRQKILWVKEA